MTHVNMNEIRLSPAGVEQTLAAINVRLLMSDKICYRTKDSTAGSAGRLAVGQRPHRRLNVEVSRARLPRSASNYRLLVATDRCPKVACAR